MQGVSSDQLWDVVIVGSGMGGATVALELAQRGFRVLILERGRRTVRAAHLTEGVSEEARLAHGWWPEPISLVQDGKYSRVTAPLGCAAGGSTIHYAAALERPEPSDLEPLVTESGEKVTWPFDFATFLPYLEKAERLFRIDADADEKTWQRLSDWDRALVSVMRKNGLHPDMLRVGIRYDAQCRECIGLVCERDCKADAKAVCLEPALKLPNCQLMEDCEVVALEADAHAVQSVRARVAGVETFFRGRIVVLSAGGLHSPQMLLRSKSDAWPDGLANTSGQVGRNIMFHSVNVFALWGPRSLNRRSAQRKSLSLRDFYVQNGIRLGYVQSMGLDADRGLISIYIKEVMTRWGLRSALLQKLVSRILSPMGEFVMGGARLFAATSEDDPHPDNRVELDDREPDGALIRYTITPPLRKRSSALQNAFARGVRPWRMLNVAGSLNVNLGHACGTCRMGDDPAVSVLNADCRAHGVENLYVVDSSFMPRCGAMNPSLTIAANALRVAPRIAEHLERVRDRAIS